MVRNPMNPRMVSKVNLSPDLTDCIVFWTKNPRPLMKHLHRLKNYHYYFLFTITPYDRDLELNLPRKEEIIDTFIELSGEIGRERVIWRYDPILLSGAVDEEYHRCFFESAAKRLGSYTERCIISFIDMYKKCERNLKGFDIQELDSEEMIRMVEMLHPLAKGCGIEMVTCAEEIDLSVVGVGHGKCIDDELISRICGYPLGVKRDGHQRKTCRCVESIDIGAYNTCNHICLYCYANSDPRVVRQNVTLHNPESPLLLGKLSGNEKVVERKIESFKKPRRGTLL